MKSSSLKVSDIGEKGLIDRIIAKTQECSNDFRSFSEDSNYSFDSNLNNLTNLNKFSQNLDFNTLIGDDSALMNLNIDENSYLVASSDMLCQSTHFPSAMSYYQMGFKSVVVNISDLSAMGAEPLGFLLNLAIPKDLAISDFDELICGVIGACNQYNISLIGGDTNEGSEIIISGTAIGKVNKKQAMLKYGFKKGDLVCITGELGLAALGFELLKDNKKFEIANKIDSSFADLAIFKALKPVAKQNESFILREFTNVATDITDGVASEFYQLLDADKKFFAFDSLNNKTYNKKIRIFENKLPFEDEFLKIANAIDLNPLDLFFHIGEDFELLFTLNPENLDNLKDKLDFFVIGEVVNNYDGDLLADEVSDSDDNLVEEDLVDEVSDSDDNLVDGESINDDSLVEIVLSTGEIKKLFFKGYEHLTNN